MTMQQSPQVDLRHLYAQYPGKRHGSAGWALEDIGLQIRRGEQIAVIGPSGAGKTTLLQTLAGASEPAQGEYFFHGQAVWQLSGSQRHRLRRQLFLAPQTPPLPPRQRVVTAVLAGRLPQWSFLQACQNLLYPSDPHAAVDALSRFHLQHKLYDRVDHLSGGERQRCGLARLLLSGADLLLVDEPLSALDPTLALQTLQALQQAARERQVSLVCSLHQVDLARRHFDRIIGLRNGKIMFDSQQVSDQMIAGLYQNAGTASAANPDSELNYTAEIPSLSETMLATDRGRCS